MCQVMLRLHLARAHPAGRSFWARALDWALDRTCVGSDAQGRKYYERIEERPRDGRVLRRTFTGDAEGDLPAEWLSWLRSTRLQPPSPEETLLLAQKRSEVRGRVAELAAEEARRKERARVLGEQRGDGADAQQLSDSQSKQDGFSPGEWRP